MQKVISPLYYAREDTRSPFRFAVQAMVVNAVVALGLAPLIGFSAAALGTTVAGWIMLFQLWRGTRGDGRDRRADARLRRALPRILLAACSMGAVLSRPPVCSPAALAEPGLRYPALAARSSAPAWRPTPRGSLAHRRAAPRRHPRRIAARLRRLRPGVSD